MQTLPRIVSVILWNDFLLTLCFAASFQLSMKRGPIILRTRMFNLSKRKSLAREHS